MIIKAADEAIDRQSPSMDTEYSMGYRLTMELLRDREEFTAIAGQNQYDGDWSAGCSEGSKASRAQRRIRYRMRQYFLFRIQRISLTTIDHFVALKGRDACDIIIRKIDTSDHFLNGYDACEFVQYRVYAEADLKKNYGVCPGKEKTVKKLI